MVLVRCFDFLLVMGSNDTLLYNLDAQFIGQLRAADAAYEAESADNKKYIILFNEDADSVIIEVRDNVAYDHYARLIQWGDYFEVEGAAPLKLRWTTYRQRSSSSNA
jgi:hypothetical protein